MNLGSGTNQYFWEMGGNVATAVIVVFCFMINIGILQELQVIFRVFVIIKGFLGVWLLFNGILNLYANLECCGNLVFIYIWGTYMFR